MTKEEAERLLKALEKDEEDTQEKVQKALIQKERSNIKNKW
jgi:hypothetical protein